MKKYEKVLLGIFGCIIAAFAADVLYKWKFLHIPLDYHMFGGFTGILAWFFIAAFFGTLTILVSWRLRNRLEAGKKPVSKLYTLSFVLSFVPFVLLLASSLSCIWEGFTFIYSTSYGGDAFWSNFVIMGVLMYCAIIPVFPVMIFWQILYIIKRIQYRKQMKATETV